MDQHDDCARPQTRPQTRPLRGTCITRTVDLANPRLIGVWKWNFEEASRRLYAVCVFAPNVLRDDYPLEDLQHLKDCIAQPGSPLNFATRCFVEMYQLSLSKEGNAGCVAAGALPESADLLASHRAALPGDYQPESTLQDILESGETLKDLRKRIRLNQRDFWGMFNIGQAGGSRYELGRSMPQSLKLQMQFVLSLVPELAVEALV